MSKKTKDFGKFFWSWFYKHFIKNTVNDNFYTSEEIMKIQKDIINRVKDKKMDYEKEKNKC